MDTRDPGGRPDGAQSRRRIRHAAAVLSLVCAATYALIGLGTIRVSDGEAQGIAVFGTVSALAFMVGGVLLLLADHRLLWIAGALFQVLAIAMYVAVSPNRTPSFEVWGIALKAIQVVLLALLVVLALPERRPRSASTAIHP